MLVLFLFGFFLLVYDLAGFYSTVFVQEGKIRSIYSSDDRTGVIENSDKHRCVLSIRSGHTRLSEPAGHGQLTPQLSFFFNQPMPINSAFEEDLVLLPGIGPHLARCIILFRQQHGAITRASELTRIPGIGPKLEKKIIPMIVFDAP